MMIVVVQVMTLDRRIRDLSKTDDGNGDEADENAMARLDSKTLSL